ncbi:MAG: alpha/beta hydrolase [Sphingobacteriales bacterium]|nr:MAG: alpha/beta hydrolase [Sphingobacteriales bacterium]
MQTSFKAFNCIYSRGAFLLGDKNEASEICKFFAEKGFTAVSINYRLGWNFGTNNCDGNMQSLKLAAYRGLQDTKAALRYLVANASVYAIDTSKIFIGGASAGSVLALQTAFINKKDVDTYFPNFEKKFNELNTSGNNLKNIFSIKGVINMWGGVFDLGIISESENIPVISFHGTNDKIIPYEVGTYAGCKNYLPVFGSKAIYDLMRQRNFNSLIHGQINGEHGVYNEAYIAANSYCFIKKIMANTKTWGAYNYFISSCQ